MVAARGFLLNMSGKAQKISFDLGPQGFRAAKIESLLATQAAGHLVYHPFP
jgi:hypothetical protein